MEAKSWALGSPVTQKGHAKRPRAESVAGNWIYRAQEVARGRLRAKRRGRQSAHGEPRVEYVAQLGSEPVRRRYRRVTARDYHPDPLAVLYRPSTRESRQLQQDALAFDGMDVLDPGTGVDFDLSEEELKLHTSEDEGEDDLEMAAVPPPYSMPPVPLNDTNDDEEEEEGIGQGSSHRDWVEMMDRLNISLKQRELHKLRALETPAVAEEEEEEDEDIMDMLDQARLTAARLRVHEPPTEEWDSTQFHSGWESVTTKMCVALKRKARLEARSHELVSRVAYCLDPMRGLRRTGGDDRLDYLHTLLDSFGVRRTRTQKLFHFWFIQSVLPLVYGDSEWEANAVRVLREHKLTTIRHEVLAMTPRRFGKTWSVAMFVIACLLAIPGIKIAIFSTGRRASTSLMKIAMGFLAKVPGAMERVVKYNGEEVFIAETPLSAGKSIQSTEARLKQTHHNTSELHSYPSSVVGMYNR